jgi:hypothetical protein
MKKIIALTTTIVLLTTSFLSNISAFEINANKMERLITALSDKKKY